ncbi:MAG: alpha/beta hydrolase [Salinimicrobium sp.]
MIAGKIDHAEEKEITVDAKTAVLDEEGRFSLEVPVKQNETLSLQYSAFQLDLFAQAGDSVFVSFDDKKKTLKFSGDHTAEQAFLLDQQEVSKSFNTYFNRNINRSLAILPEPEFVRKTDSLKMTFLEPLFKREQELDKDFVENYRRDIQLFFLSLLADFPLLHYKTTGEKAKLTEAVKSRLEAVDITNSELYAFEGFKRLLHNFLYRTINSELETGKYSSSDNQRLDAGFAVIDKTFGYTAMYDRVLFEFFENHIANLGVKNIQNNYDFFMKRVSNPVFKTEIRELYESEKQRRKGHLIVPYKTINGHHLDAHIFQPDSLQKGEKHPVIAMFHGGSFFEGKPDWFFNTAQAYAEKDWVAIAVEYRVADRHGNKLPEAISDGKSLVRFLRANAERFQLDPNKILVTGNSSGATIALALATTGEILDEPKEDLQISSIPNAVIANAGLADLREAGYWWQENYREEFIDRISPLNNPAKKLPPILLFHGTRDNSVDIGSIREFSSRARENGNDVKLVELKGAPHMIWLIPYFSKQMKEPRDKFFKKLNW